MRLECLRATPPVPRPYEANDPAKADDGEEYQDAVPEVCRIRRVAGVPGRDCAVGMRGSVRGGSVHGVVGTASEARGGNVALSRHARRML